MPIVLMKHLAKLKASQQKAAAGYLLWWASASLLLHHPTILFVLFISVHENSHAQSTLDIVRTQIKGLIDLHQVT